MKNQVKVTKTESYSDPQKGKITVCRGKFVLIPIDQKKDPFGSGPPNYFIVSKTEEIEVGDTGIILDKSNVNYGYTVRITSEDKSQYTVVLALPENFSPKQIDAIVDGKLKNGDDVLLECTVKDREEWMGDNETGEPFMMEDYFIKLNKDNHITLLPVAKPDVLLCESCKKFMHAPKEKCDYCGSTSLSQTHVANGHYAKKESWDEIIKKVNYVRGYCLSQEQIALLKENYVPPTRKQS